MKRIVKKRKSSKLRTETMRQLRDMRAALDKEHPELMKAMRKLVAKTHAQPAPPVKKEKSLKKEIPDDAVQIDREKNLEAILKYAASKPASDELKKELKDFLN